MIAVIDPAAMGVIALFIGLAMILVGLVDRSNERREWRRRHQARR